MDEYSGKRAVNGIIVPRKGSGLVLRDTVNNREQNAQFCNRIGCSGRINSMKASQIGCSEKPKSSRPAIRASSSGKEVIGSSSRTYPVVSNVRKPSTKPRKSLSSQLETDSSETSSVQDEPEVAELVSQPGKIRRGLPSESEDTDFREDASMEAGSSSSNTRSRRNLNQRSGLGNQDNLAGSSVLLASRSPGQATRANASRYGLRNLKCNSISDVVPSGSLSSDSSLNKRKNTIKKRNSEGESSSSAKGKKMSGASFEGRNHGSNPGISISDSRQARNWPPNRDNGVVSVRTQRSTNSYSRARLSILGNGNNLSSNESIASIPQMPQSDISIDLNSPLSSQQFSVESSSGRLNSYSRPGSSSEGLRSFMPGSPSQAGITHSLMNLDSFRRYNMDGIAEVLSALERIEQDEELTYEQLLVLETSLFLNGLNFHDQHREMRLDIDNMSYEELLALEERMGTVSTALTEEALSKCLETSIYQSMPLGDDTTGCDGNKNDVKRSGNMDDVKCSICQEEYVDGEEVGRLRCDHRYHVACVHQWLRLKNWCPICKSSAEPLLPPSSPPPSL